jgi:benzoate membrane transport protein
MKFISQLKKDASLSAIVAGLIIVLVGMSSSAVVVFQAAIHFGANAAQASSWLGSLCLGMGFLTIYFSWRYRAPVLMAWSTPGAVILASSAEGISMSEAVGAFLFSATLIFLCGATGLFERFMNRIPLSLTAALLAGVLFHFCTDAFVAFKVQPVLVSGMFLAYVIAKRQTPRLTMLVVLATGALLSAALGLFKIDQIDVSLTTAHFTAPSFSWAAIAGLGIPLFIVTMAAQNLTGIAVMRTFRFSTPLSPLLVGSGATNFVAAFFGGFAINLAAITAAIGMGPEVHEEKEKRYISALVAGFIYILIGIFAGSVTSLFAALPAQMISAIAGFALLGTVAASLESALSDINQKESAFLTFIIAASGISFLGVGSSFWAIVIGLVFQVWNSSRSIRTT